jgi:hypothetical protein
MFRNRETIDELRLTDAELDALRGVSLPEGVQRALKKNPNDLFTTTAGYRKLAGMLRAQADVDRAYVESMEARQAREQIETGEGDVTKIRRERDEARMALRQSQAEISALHRETERLIAAPALTEPSRSTR